jgi:hypothetical protein
MPISRYIETSNLARPGVCTSTTRPASPYEGQTVYLTDTDLLQIWTGAEWRTIAAATASSGAVLQTKQAVVNTATSTTSTSRTDITGLSLSITPSASTSKILVQATLMIGFDTTADDTWYYLVRDSTLIGNGSGASTANSSAFQRGNAYSLPALQIVPVTFSFLDSPATTSATTYKLQWQTRVGTIYLNRRGNDTNTVVSSSITVQEIAA